MSESAYLGPKLAPPRGGLQATIVPAVPEHQAGQHEAVLDPLMRAQQADQVARAQHHFLQPQSPLPK